MTTSSLGVKRCLVLAGLGILALAGFSTDVAGQQFALKEGDTVVFCGDSITA
jgi:hypothetical protein